MNTSRIVKRLTHLWHLYGTTNNIVIAVALIVAATWAWGSINTMQRNFALQRAVDEKRRELEIATLEKQKLVYEQNYYNTDEYKDLAAREHLGLASPGEKVLILPPNSDAVKAETAREERPVTTVREQTAAQSNMAQWISFLSGASAKGLQR